MEKLDRDFKGVWIPKEIFENKELTLTEKCYISIYNYYLDFKITDSIILEAISHKTLERSKKKLANLDLIPQTKIDSPEDAKMFVINHVNSLNTCEWCGKKSYVLHKHHFPVSRLNGGTKTVDICPNCHSLFHSVYNNKREASNNE